MPTYTIRYNDGLWCNRDDVTVLRDTTADVVNKSIALHIRCGFLDPGDIVSVEETYELEEAE